MLHAYQSCFMAVSLSVPHSGHYIQGFFLLYSGPAYVKACGDNFMQSPKPTWKQLKEIKWKIMNYIKFIPASILVFFFFFIDSTKST